MTTLTTNRFLTKALRALCCTGAFTACSAWATVVSWQLSQSTLSQGSTQPEESSLFAASNTQAHSTTPLGASAFDDGFVSVPNYQFASTARGSKELSALFPIVGLIAAVSCTQILRRRREAEQSAYRRLV